MHLALLCWWGPGSPDCGTGCHSHSHTEHVGQTGAFHRKPTGNSAFWSMTYRCFVVVTCWRICLGDASTRILLISAGNDVISRTKNTGATEQSRETQSEEWTQGDTQTTPSDHVIYESRLGHMIPNGCWVNRTTCVVQR